MLEKNIEQYLVESVISKGGICWKLVSPGNSGVPDRIVIFNSKIFLVELKKPKGGKLSPLQEYRIQQLKKLNHDVRVLNTKSSIDEFLFSIGV